MAYKNPGIFLSHPIFFLLPINDRSPIISSEQQQQRCTFEDEIGWIYIFAAALGGGSSSSLLSASSAICQIKAPTHPLVKVLIGILFLLSSFPHTYRGEYHRETNQIMRVLSLFTSKVSALVLLLDQYLPAGPSYNNHNCTMK